MADIYTPAGRSALMARIRSRGNASTEGALARVLRAAGLSGWRRQQVVRGRDRVGGPFRTRPDFVFRALRVAVFVDGCFWHGCPAHGGRPRGNRAFWARKFRANRARDRRDTRNLRAAGWTVLRLWEHELRARGRAALLRRLRRALGAEPAQQKARPSGRASGRSGRTAQSAR
jgi:DNA mismatch endonuclease (patch repair protein)